MALFTKCILKPKEASDGFRISVMSRHALNDGKTPHPQITTDSFDAHCIELSPSPRLIGDYYKRGLQWEDFEVRFKEEMSLPSALEKLKEIIKKAEHENVTLLCIEETCECCHRRLLAEVAKELNLNLIIEHH